MEFVLTTPAYLTHPSLCVACVKLFVREAPASHGLLQNRLVLCCKLILLTQTTNNRFAGFGTLTQTWARVDRFRFFKCGAWPVEMVSVHVLDMFQQVEFEIVLQQKMCLCLYGCENPFFFLSKSEILCSNTV